MRYLILTYYRKADGKIDETMAVSNRVRRSDVQTANIILDFKDLAVVKATMSGQQVPKDFNRIVEYYYQHYKSTIDRLFAENGYQAELVTQDNNEQKTDAS